MARRRYRRDIDPDRPRVHQFSAGLFTEPSEQRYRQKASLEKVWGAICPHRGSGLRRDGVYIKMTMAEVVRREYAHYGIRLSPEGIRARVQLPESEYDKED